MSIFSFWFLKVALSARALVYVLQIFIHLLFITTLCSDLACILFLNPPQSPPFPLFWPPWGLWGSWARDQIQATIATHCARPRTEPASLWKLVRFVSAEPQEELLTGLFQLRQARDTKTLVINYQCYNCSEISESHLPCYLLLAFLDPYTSCISTDLIFYLNYL